MTFPDPSAVPPITKQQINKKPHYLERTLEYEIGAEAASRSLVSVTSMTNFRGSLWVFSNVFWMLFSIVVWEAQEWL